MKDEALKWALEVLEENHHLIEEHERPEYLAHYDRVISAVSKALAAPVQEPAAYLFTNVQSGDIESSTDPDHKQGEREMWFREPLVRLAAPQPAVPDAIHHTDTSETLEYIQGWNDCRAETLKMRKP
jgi:hypothetical protein